MSYELNLKIDKYLAEGCGRCPLGGTPQCKVHNWVAELELLRSLVLACGLKEELKWGVPCYTFKNKNLLILAAFKDYCSISFFKGSLLKDTSRILEMPGENSQAARIVRFTDLKEIPQKSEILKGYIQEAIEVEEKGLKVEFKKAGDFEIPAELQQKFIEEPAYKKAFYALTPGRQRSYLIHFSQPKQSATKLSRIEKCREKIFQGKGFNER